MSSSPVGGVEQMDREHSATNSGGLLWGCMWNLQSCRGYGPPPDGDLALHNAIRLFRSHVLLLHSVQWLAAGFQPGYVEKTSLGVSIGQCLK